MIIKINYLLSVILLLFAVSCSVDPSSPEVIPVAEQFKSNITGNYSSDTGVLSVNGTRYNLVGGQGIRLSPDDLTITLKTADTSLPFTLSEIISATEATYIYDGTPVTVTVDDDKNILINGVIVANYVDDTTASTFAANVQGGYVTTTGEATTRSPRSLEFLLDEHTHSPIGEDLHITLIKDNNDEAKLLYVQAIDASNAIYLLEGTTRSTENDLPVKILANGYLSVNGTTLLRRVQDNAPDFTPNISKVFITEDVTVTLGATEFDIEQHRILQIDLGEDIVLQTDKGELTLTFDRAVNANEGIFDYTHGGFTDKENIHILDDTILELEGIEIAKAPNPVAEIAFKDNMTYSSYATVGATVTTAWEQTFNFLEGSIFDITTESLDLKLKTAQGEVIWEYVFAYSETEAVYSYNGNYTVITLDPLERKIYVSVGDTDTMIAESLTLYNKELFIADLIAEDLTMVKPTFTKNNIDYALPLLPFKPSTEDISIIDANGEKLVATFVQIIDANTAKYDIVTKTGTVNNVTVHYQNGDLSINNQLVAMQTIKLTPFEINFVGRYFINTYESAATPGTYAYLNDTNVLEIYTDYSEAVAGYEIIFRFDHKITSIKGHFKYQIIYQGNPMRSRQEYPQEIKDFIAQVSKDLETRESPPVVNEYPINLTFNDPSIYLNIQQDPFFTKIAVRP